MISELLTWLAWLEGWFESTLGGGEAGGDAKGSEARRVEKEMRERCRLHVCAESCSPDESRDYAQSVSH